MVGEKGGMSGVGYLSKWDAGKGGWGSCEECPRKENSDGTQAFKGGDTAHTMANEEDAGCACVLGHTFCLTPCAVGDLDSVEPRWDPSSDRFRRRANRIPRLGNEPGASRCEKWPGSADTETSEANHTDKRTTWIFVIVKRVIRSGSGQSRFDG